MMKQAFLFVLTFVALLFLGELFIRTSHLGSVSPTEFYPDIGRGRRKSLTYLYFNEGFGVGKFNRYRYLGEPNPPTRKQNTIRVVLLGDSYVESFQVFERDYFGEIAEQYLRRKYPDLHFEFLNFGRSGFDMADMYAYQKTFADSFNPDYVLYMISNQDLIPNYTDPLRPKTLIENDSLIISFNFDAKEMAMFAQSKFLTQNLCLMNLLNNGRKRAMETSISAILFDKIYWWFNHEANSEKTRTENGVRYQMNPVTRKIVESLDPEKTVIVNIDVQKLPSAFLRLCNDHQLNYFDLGISLRQMKENGEDPGEWVATDKKGHWNHKAHQTIGKDIALYISQLMDEKVVDSEPSNR